MNILPQAERVQGTITSLLQTGRVQGTMGILTLSYKELPFLLKQNGYRGRLSFFYKQYGYRGRWVYLFFHIKNDHSSSNSTGTGDDYHSSSRSAGTRDDGYTYSFI